MDGLEQRLTAKIDKLSRDVLDLDATRNERLTALEDRVNQYLPPAAE